MNSNYPHPLIAREGWTFIGFAFVLTFIIQSSYGFAGAWPLWAITLFILQFFRDPARPIPTQKNAVVSPADGRIVAVENTNDPYAQREALKISVFMNVFNVHSNRIPVDGAITQIEYFRGSFFNAALDKASEKNERNALVIHTNHGHTVTCVQIAGLIARRILCYVKASDQVTRGQRYGFIRFGSRVDIYLPLTAKPRISIGDKVFASKTVLADFLETEPPIVGTNS